MTEFEDKLLAKVEDIRVSFLWLSFAGFGSCVFLALIWAKV